MPQVSPTWRHAVISELNITLVTTSSDTLSLRLYYIERFTHTGWNCYDAHGNWWCRPATFTARSVLQAVFRRDAKHNVHACAQIHGDVPHYAEWRWGVPTTYSLWQQSLFQAAGRDIPHLASSLEVNMFVWPSPICGWRGVVGEC
jgi:hypothetical protein